MKPFILTALMSLFAVSAAAQQDTAPIVEFSAQYQLLQAEGRPTVPHFTGQGGSLGIAVDFFDQLQGVLEVGTAYNDNIGGSRLKNAWLTYLAGPRVSLRNRARRVIPALELLVGGATAFGSGRNRTTLIPVAGNSTGFAGAAGFVLDIRLTRLIALRPIQADYLLTMVNNDTIQNNFRYQAGIVFTLGTQE